MRPRAARVRRRRRGRGAAAADFVADVARRRRRRGGRVHLRGERGAGRPGRCSPRSTVLDVPVGADRHLPGRRARRARRATRTRNLTEPRRRPLDVLPACIEAMPVNDDDLDARRGALRARRCRRASTSCTSVSGPTATPRRSSPATPCSRSSTSWSRSPATTRAPAHDHDLPRARTRRPAPVARHRRGEARRPGPAARRRHRRSPRGASRPPRSVDHRRPMRRCEMDAEREKQLAAEAAARSSPTACASGSAPGSTVAYLLEALARRGSEGRVRGDVAAHTRDAAIARGMPVEAFDHSDRLDLAIDGADQVAAERVAHEGRRRRAHAREGRRRVRRAIRRHRRLLQARRASCAAPVPLELSAFGLRVHAAPTRDRVACATAASSPDGGVIADYRGRGRRPGEPWRRGSSATPGVIAPRSLRARRW